MRAMIVLAIAIAGTVSADPKPRSNPSWADWAGSYRGALTWSGCTIAGTSTATIPLSFVDGVASIDLTSTRPGMRALSLVADERGFSGRQGDIAVEIKHLRTDAIELQIEIDGGCLVRGKLARGSTGITSCDRLLGWARIDAACTKQPAPVDDLSKLLATKWKSTDATTCMKRAETLEHALIDAGCAPHPDPKIGVRSPDCLDLGQQAARISRCANVLPAIKSAAVSAAQAIVSASQSADRSTLPVVEQQCRDARAELIAIATKFGCP